MRFQLLLGWTVLLVSLFDYSSCQASSTDGTTPTTSSVTSEATISTTPNEGQSSTSIGGTQTANSSGSTTKAGTAASSTSPASAATASEATSTSSTAATGVTTTKLTTSVGTMGPATSAALPNVSVSYISFAIHCDVGAQCEYVYDTPKNNRKFVATEQSMIDDDRTTFNSLQQNVTTMTGAIGTANEAAVQQVQNLQQHLDTIRKQLDDIGNLVNNISDLQRNANANVASANQYINAITNNQRDSCFYTSCLRPTPPPTPTPTTTRRPTTTPGACENFDCPNSDCQLDPFKRPFCQKCPGNLYGYDQCKTSQCVSGSGYAFVPAPMGGESPFVSPGYNITTNVTDAGISNSSSCVWTVPSATDNGYYTVGSLDLTALDASVKLTIFFGTTSQAITNTTSKTTLQRIFQRAGPYKVTLTTQNNVPAGAFFSWTLTSNAATSASVEEFLLEKIQPQRRRSFLFSWI